VPVALAAHRSLPAYLRIARYDFVDFSASRCCNGEMVQFVAPHLADTATRIDYPERGLPRYVAFVCR
jgi:hypothetical protein